MMWNRFLVAVCVVSALWLALVARSETEGRDPRQDSDLIFEISDPFGDDRGDGSLRYPSGRSDLEPGDLDLLSLRAVRAEEGTLFRATFARPLRAPGGEVVDGVGTSREQQARFGFYTFNFDLHIDTDRVPGSGHVAMLPGRRAEVAPTDAWEKLIVLTPRPHTLRASLERLRVAEWREEESLERTVTNAETRRRRRQIAEELLPLVYFPTRVKVRGRSVDFFVPEAFLGGRARADWSYVAAVSGALLEQRFTNRYLSRFSREAYDGMILPIVPGRDSEAFGGGREGEPLQPPLVDILTPPGDDQGRILGTFDSFQGQPAQIPGVVPDNPPVGNTPAGG